MNNKQIIFFQPDNDYENNAYQKKDFFIHEGKKFLVFHLNNTILFSEKPVDDLIVPDDNSIFVNHIKETMRGVFYPGRRILDYFTFSLDDLNNFEYKPAYSEKWRWGKQHGLLIKDTSKIKEFGKVEPNYKQLIFKLAGEPEISEETWRGEYPKKYKEITGYELKIEPLDFGIEGLSINKINFSFGKERGAEKFKEKYNFLFSPESIGQEFTIEVNHWEFGSTYQTTPGFRQPCVYDKLLFIDAEGWNNFGEIKKISEYKKSSKSNDSSNKKNTNQEQESINYHENKGINNKKIWITIFVLGIVSALLLIYWLWKRKKNE
ncbi:hypothetical protein [endosymbiont GvMRE of Glomus versiforme]|uniref:hypothetical protein n=1 Tax=endosymbiont GvMRE of Glomus versiforme TaxID=2039283 RepID=UPI000EE5759C|nr:hypothetical protein [endosymbiont GvMRE of Glomus versiforme]RHZ37111.1 hypothetical protein GvMRE_I1g26 [endosymbiont GvMRE of Glomus versiforme]